MVAQGVDVLVLLHTPHVNYATGFGARGIDITHAVHDRPVAIVVAGEDRPHLLFHGEVDTPGVERHGGVAPEFDEGAEKLAGLLAEITGGVAERSVGVDEQTGAMLRIGCLDGARVVDGTNVVGAAKLTKTADELSCIATAQRANEHAMVATRLAIEPGADRNEVAAVFLGELAALDVEADMIDPIFQVMPRTIAEGPRTTTGDVAFPTGLNEGPFVSGDLIWVDSGMTRHGYASDFGRTWIVGRDPEPSEQALFERWCEVVAASLDVLRPGCTSGDLGRAATAANGGDVPWLPHFDLAHGLGVESAEMPFVGTDLGQDFDDGFVLAPGMVLVFEPVVWDDGTGGYRAEEIVAVTEDGWTHLGGGHGWEPFDV